jgi:hypothetical protein
MQCVNCKTHSNSAICQNSSCPASDNYKRR